MAEAATSRRSAFAPGLRRRFYAAFGVTAALTCAVGALGWVHVEALGRNVETVAQAVTPVLAENVVLRDVAARLHALSVDAAAAGAVPGYELKVAEADRMAARSLERVDRFLPASASADAAVASARRAYAGLAEAVRGLGRQNARRGSAADAAAGAASALLAAERGIQVRDRPSWIALDALDDALRRDGSPRDGGAVSSVGMEDALRGLTHPADAAALRTALLGEGGLLARRAALAAEEAALAAQAARVRDLETAFGEAVDTVGDVSRELLWTARHEQRGTVARARLTAVAAVVVSLALAALACFLFARRILDPLADMTAAMRRLSTGDLDAAVPPATGRDEIADLAAAMRVFKMNARERVALEARLAEDREALILAGERQRGEEAVRAQNARFDAALNNMSQGLAMFDADHRLLVCNAAYAAMFSLPAHLARPGTPLSEILAHRKASGGIAPGADYDTLVCDGTEIRKLSGYLDGRHVSMRRTPLPGGGWVTTYADVTEQRRWDERYRHMAAHDALTDLPNRVTFRERLEGSLHGACPGAGVAVHCLDLDRFKEVNDTLGHPVGDGLLRQVAGRLSEVAGGEALVARLGGDEFAIIQPVAGPAEARELADAVLAAIARPFHVEGHRIAVGVSVGYAMAFDPGRDADNKIRRADIALYAAKGLGRGRACEFEEAMEADVVERRAMEADLRAALAADALELHYQPLVSFETGEVTGVEALMRWTHPVRGAVPPSAFIPVAEQSGLICRLGEWALRRACRDALLWPDHVRVAVNLSPEQFRRGEDIVGIVRDVLSDSGLLPERLGLEITESVLLDEDERTLASLHDLRALGVTVSLDDFGTGFSSLGYLTRFPFDKIKVDQSFVRGMVESQDCAAIVRAVVGLARDIGIRTVAEGIETPGQHRALSDLGCGEAQGYLVSRPLPLADATAFIVRANQERAAA